MRPNSSAFCTTARRQAARYNMTITPRNSTELNVVGRASVHHEKPNRIPIRRLPDFQIRTWVFNWKNTLLMPHTDVAASRGLENESTSAPHYNLGRRDDASHHRIVRVGGTARARQEGRAVGAAVEALRSRSALPFINASSPLRCPSSQVDAAPSASIDRSWRTPAARNGFDAAHREPTRPAELTARIDRTTPHITTTLVPTLTRP